MISKEVLTFKPKKVTRALLTVLPERAQDILKMRFGLESDKGLTLEAIGKKYQITRERVRQIEDFSLKTIRRSSVMNESAEIFSELQSAMEQYGGIVHEQEFLNHLSGERMTQNNIHFLLVLGDAFSKVKEGDSFYHHWTTDPELAEGVRGSLKNLCTQLSEDQLLSEQEIIDTFLKNLYETLSPEQAKAHAKRYLMLSKEIGKSPIGDWGLTSSPNVYVRGIRDYAYLIMRKHGSPMHFTEVAKAIQQNFGRKANSATCHNELIKDGRFILVGRGIYALSEWGYIKGVVRDVIRQIIKDNGPLSKEEILSKVMKERYVKENTVMVNIKNRRYFKQDKQGRYTLV